MEILTQCEGCYEKFSVTDIQHQPRKLKCLHILCTECIERDHDGSVFYCPFCFEELNGGIDDISKVDLTICEEKSEIEIVPSLSLSTSLENVVSPKASSLTMFTRSNPSSPSLGVNSPDERGSRTSDPFKYGECKEENCQKKACAAHGYCLAHSSKKKYSVMTESKIADALANTPLDFMSVEGNSVQLRDSTHIWPEVEPAELINRFRDQKRMSMGEAIDLINRAKIIFSREPNILHLQAPVVVIGDIHGQFYDLLNIFEVGGNPGVGDHYLFLGDYVDRGSFSCEVILTLLAYKVIYPDRVWLIRGNHECASVSGHFGFKEECKMKYGVQVYYSFLLLFQSLPLAAVITTGYGQLFACHGGLSPTIQTLEDLSKIERFVEPEENSSLLDILWSDPISEEAVDEMTVEEYEQFISIEWKPNPTRGCSYFYGYQAVHNFLEKNNLISIIRAHEVQELGFHKHFDPSSITERLHIPHKSKFNRRITSAVLSHGQEFRHDSLAQLKSPMAPTSSRRPFVQVEESSDSFNDGSYNEKVECEIDIPSVITVFSAPNYCDRYANKGAILKIGSIDITTQFTLIDTELQGFRVLQYDCVEHPKPEITESQMNNHLLTVIAICPYMPTSFRDFVRLAIDLGPEENLIEDEEVYEVQIPQQPLSLITEESTTTSLSTPNKEISVPTSDSQSQTTSDGSKTHPSTPVEEKRPKKIMLWQTISEEDTETPEFDTPKAKRISHSTSLPQAEREHIFSPQEVRKRSSSMKKAGGSTEISVITRAGSHGASFSAEDIPSPTPRSPEFSLGVRNRSQSERIFPNKQLRRLSSGARLEGTAKAAAELAKLEEYVSPIKENISPEGKKPSRRSSTAGNYVSRYKSQVMRSSTYTQALASDAINELHPDQLARFMKNIEPANFKLSEHEKPITPVAALKMKFEKKAVGDQHHYVSFARQELLEYSQSVERGRTASVATLRDKFDRKARENIVRHLADTKRNKFRKRSASLEPTPSPDETKRSNSNELDENIEIRGRSRRLSVESYFQVDKSSRAHSLSPVPAQQVLLETGHQSPPPGSSLTSTTSPPRQRAMAMICADNRTSFSESTATTRDRADAVDSNLPPKNLQSPEIRSSPRVSAEYDFLLKYKPDNENKVHFTMRELLALRLLFSLFDRSGSAMIGYEDLVAYGEETGGLAGIRDAASAIEIVDIDGDGKIGLLDFIHFAARLQLLFQRNLMKRVLDELLMNAAASNPI